MIESQPTDHGCHPLPEWMLPTLRSRLLFGVSLGWLALVVALLGYSHISGGALAQRENLTHLAYEAELIADQLQRSVEDRQRALARLRPSLSVDDPALLDKLRAQEGLLALFDRLMVFDAEGEPVAAWPPFPEGGPRSPSVTTFIRRGAFAAPWLASPTAAARPASTR